MTTIYAESHHGDDGRREHLYRGDLYTYSARAATTALCEWAAEMLTEAFAPLDPQLAQHELPVERFVEIFAPVKPRFIHHPRTMELVRELLGCFEVDLEETYVDVPRLRGVTSDGYLTSGVGFAHHPHRDTWWSAPLCQLNWWLPIFPMAGSSSMAFHPRYFDTPVANGSHEFSYAEWNSVGRAEAAKHVHSDTRKQPKPLEELDLQPEVRCVLEPGGLLVFSPAHLHSTVANTSGLTRFSIDFRTVHLADVRADRGATNIDSRPTGTSLRDFRRTLDLAAMPDDVVARHDDEVTTLGRDRFVPATGA